MKSINEEEKENKEKDVKKKESVLGKKSSDYFLLNIVSHLFNNVKIFKKKIIPKYVDYILRTDDSISSIDKLNYELNIIYTLFSQEVINLNKDNIISCLDFEDEYEKKETIFNNIDIDLTPKIGLNHYLNLSDIPLQYYNYKSKKAENYEIKTHINNNKFRLFFCLEFFNDYTLKNIENLKHTIDFLFYYFENIYIIFQVRNFEKVEEIINDIEEAEKEKEIIKKEDENVVNDDNKEIKYLFYINNKNNKGNKNVFDFFKDCEEEYYFILDNNNEIIFMRNDTKNIVENIFQFILPFKKDKKSFIDYAKEKEKTENEIGLLVKQLINFITKVKKLDYAFYLEFNCSFSASINEEYTDIKIKKINELIINGEFRIKEYQYLKNILSLIKEKSKKDIINYKLEEIPTVDIDVDFTEMKCLNCSTIIPDDKHFYYCYICKTKYCYECVQKQLKNEGKKKYIDQKHNLLFFKTKNLNNFKNIDKHKLGNNLFAETTSDDELGSRHSSICNGCRDTIRNMARYVCLNCRPGRYISDGFVDYCQKCVEKMCNNEDEKRNLEMCADEQYEIGESMFLEGYIYHNIHKHDEHIYLLLPLQYISYQEY